MAAAAAVPSLKLPSGDEMPAIGLGTWKSKEGAVLNAVHHAIKNGYRHIDTAKVYSNHKEVGEGMRKALSEVPGLERKDLFVVSKLWITEADPKHVEPACRDTLQELGLDYLDLYLIHWPMALKKGKGPVPRNADGAVEYDTDQHPTKTWLAMEKLVEKGLVRNIGMSNFNNDQIKDILEKGKIKPATNQIESHPYLAQKEIYEFCAKNGIVATAYSPLGSPDRPFKDDKKALLDDDGIKAIAKKHGKTAAQVCIRWQIQRGAAVIPKSVTPSRIDENFDIFDFELSAEDMKAIDSMDIRMHYIVFRLKGTDGTAPHYPYPYLDFTG